MKSVSNYKTGFSRRSSSAAVEESTWGRVGEKRGIKTDYRWQRSDAFKGSLALAIPSACNASPAELGTAATSSVKPSVTS